MRYDHLYSSFPKSPALRFPAFLENAGNLCILNTLPMIDNRLPDRLFAPILDDRGNNVVDGESNVFNYAFTV
jgi:hypothetical protein